MNDPRVTSLGLKRVAMVERDRVFPAHCRKAQFAHLDKWLQDAIVQHHDRKWWFLSGPCGTGKTYAAAALIKQMLAYGHGSTNTQCVSASKLVDDVTASYGRGYEGDTRESVISRYAETKGWLLLDDLGDHAGSPHSVSVIWSLFRDRYEANLPTVITSNLDIQAVSVHYGDRMASRLLGDAVILMLQGADRRMAQPTIIEGAGHNGK